MFPMNNGQNCDGKPFHVTTCHEEVCPDEVDKLKSSSNFTTVASDAPVAARHRTTDASGQAVMPCGNPNPVSGSVSPCGNSSDMTIPSKVKNTNFTFQNGRLKSAEPKEDKPTTTFWFERLGEGTDDDKKGDLAVHDNENSSSNASADGTKNGTEEEEVGDQRQQMSEVRSGASVLKALAAIAALLVLAPHL